eukprot:11088997-Lingulodinium_polyedra.AAC.1
MVASCPRDCGKAARAVPFPSGQGGCTILGGGTGQHLAFRGVAYSLQAGSYRPLLWAHGLF